MCSTEIKTTENHRFLVREKFFEWNNERKTSERKFLEPTWVECKDINKNHYMGIAINQNSILPDYKGIECTRGCQTYIKNNLRMDDKQLWYICGRYLGDGWIRNRKDRNNNLGSVVICCGKHKAEAFEKELDGWMPYCKVEERTAYKYQFANKELATFLNQFGRGAKNKFIPSFVFDLPQEYIQELLRGYIDSDGHKTKEGVFRVSSISKELIYGIGQLVAKAFNRPFSILFTKNNPTKMIEGRLVCQSEYTYILSFKPDQRKSDRAFYEDGYIWCPIKNVIETEEYEEVYDIEVENSHSLTVNGVIAHNCQSFSLAGLQHGGDEGSGTRSSLMWNTVQIVKEIKPKIIIWENVKNVLSVKHKHNFDRYVDTLNEYGYNNYYKVINAKHHGVPQNRERIFVVSIRKDIDNGLFKFPEPYELKTRLKDLLDNIVDEKYYLSDEQISKIQSSTYIQNKRRIQDKDYADTLCARDFKDPKCVQVEEPVVDRMYGIFDTEKSKHQAGSVYDKEGLAPTLDTMQGGYRQPCVEEIGGVAIPEATKKGYKMAYEGDGIYINRPHQKRGCVQRNMIQTLKTSCTDVGVVVGTYQHAKSDKFMQGRNRFQEGKDIADTVQTTPKEGVVIVEPQVINPLKDKTGYGWHFEQNVYDEEGITRALKSGGGSGNIPKVVGGIGDKKSNSGKQWYQQDRIYDNEAGISVTTSCNPNYIDKKLRIRKLTPLECWRLMDFDDEDFYKAQKSLNDTCYKGKDRSSSQLYKQAGNSIVVNVLYEILLELYKVLPNEFNELSLLSLFSGIGSPEKALERLYNNVINKED